MNYKIAAALTLFYLAPFATASSSTADISRPNPVFGIQGGLDFENAKTPAQITTNTYTGFSVGATLELLLSPLLSLQPEVNYVRRGLNLVDAGGVSSNVSIHSLEVPLLLKLGFGSRVRPFAFVGPMAVANISSMVEGSINGQTASAAFNPKALNFAGVAGVGIEIGTFFLTARYTLGITSINDNTATWQARGFRAMAGLQL